MQRQSTSYSIVLIVSTLAMLIATAAVNAVIDPFGMYRWIDIPGVNIVKPAIYHRVRLLKAYEVRRRQPDSLVLGSSRVHLGIRPSHSGWSSAFRQPYNLAFDGAMTKEMYHYLQHSHAAGPLRHVMLGLDTYHLSSAPGTTRPGFDASLLLNNDRWLNEFRKALVDMRLLVGIDTLWESVNTVRSQAPHETPWLAEDGQRLGELFFRRPQESFQKYGARHYFDEINKLEVGFKLEWRIPVKRQRRTEPAVQPPADPVTSLGYIDKIITYCRQHDIALQIFLTPSHAHQLELAALTGGWPAIEQGKRALVELLAEDAARNPDLSPVQFWDFSGYSSVTTEPLPPPGSRMEMRYYWDSSHFKENVGDWILDRLLDSATAENPAPADFGRRLDVTTIERVIAEDRLRQIDYRRSVPADIAQLSGWVEDYKQRHRIVD